MTSVVHNKHQSDNPIFLFKGKLFSKEKMGDGYNPNEPEHAKYCEVIQIGIEDDTAEVTIFYTSEKRQFYFIILPDQT